MKLVRGLLYLLAFAIVAGMSFAGVARFTEGGIGPFPGGPLVSGPLVEDPIADWSFAEGIGEVTLQLLNPPRSRTTWIVVQRGKAYIPCGMPNFRLWKQWPHQAVADGRALVRIEGKRFRVDLTRIEDPPLEAALLEALGQKYSVPERYEGTIWFFALDAPSAD